MFFFRLVFWVPLLFASPAFAEDTVDGPTEKDFKTYWQQWQDYLRKEGKQAGIDSAVMFQLGKPYLVGSLECEGDELLRYHIDGFDCFTLTEAALAMCLLEEGSQKDYERILMQTRYRDHQPDGYASRIHYATEWSDHCVALGFLEDVTGQLENARVWEKEINFMTTHADFYPKLKDRETYEQIQRIEKKLSKRKRYYLPLSEVEKNLKNFLPGDIVLILTRKKGLDAGHFCYVTDVKGKEQTQLEAVHASSTHKKILKVDSMLRYLSHYPKIMGVMVLRIKKK
ncbi:MAG: hypothetical protein CR997_06940 [Acidobacteria bacterium]|nr:MAG: hypothetical protein CR997_06940 [Acidobacteriota bacterium]